MLIKKINLIQQALTIFKVLVKINKIASTVALTNY